jgi:Na+-translocating ferredoxin:NAD+ oxidoreductase RnfA subunit
MDPLLNCSVMHVELWNSHDRVSAIEGCFEALAGAGVVSSDEVSRGSIKERVEVCHVPRHVVGPFENLGSDVDQECV